MSETPQVDVADLSAAVDAVRDKSPAAAAAPPPPPASDPYEQFRLFLACTSDGSDPGCLVTDFKLFPIFCENA